LSWLVLLVISAQADTVLVKFQIVSFALRRFPGMGSRIRWSDEHNKKRPAQAGRFRIRCQVHIDDRLHSSSNAPIIGPSLRGGARHDGQRTH